MVEAILYSIFYLIFCGALLFCVGACISVPLIYAYCSYHLGKSENKIEWKCEETEGNYERRITTAFVGKPEERIEFRIGYRVKPSELNWFVRRFGNNDWVYPFPRAFGYYKGSEEDFNELVKDYVTLGDIRKLERKEGRITWYKYND